MLSHCWRTQLSTVSDDTIQMNTIYPRPMEGSSTPASSDSDYSLSTKSTLQGKSGVFYSRHEEASVASQDDIFRISAPPYSHLSKSPRDIGSKRCEVSIDPDLRSRNIAVVALAAAWGIGIASLACGVRLYTSPRAIVPSWILGKMIALGPTEYPFWPSKAPNPTLYIPGHLPVRLPAVTMFLISLLLNIFLTVVLDSMNSIPATTMRWALQREGRLGYNSNLRLFTSAKHFSPNRWYANVISCIALVMAYGGISSLVAQIQILGNTQIKSQLANTSIEGWRYGLDFNAWGWIGLGTGLTLQSAMVTWALLASKRLVKTWNSNPLGTAKACLAVHDPRITPAARLSTPTTTDYLRLSHPRHKQSNMLRLAPHTRTIANFVWCLFGLISIWTIVVGIVAARGSGILWSLNDLQNTLGGQKEVDSLDYWNFYGQVFIRYAYGHPWLARMDWLGLVIQCLLLSVITLSVHCVEVVAHATRDESIWRRATSTRGADPNQGVFMAGLSNWPNLVLFVFKSVIHWLFGSAVITDLYLYMNLLPLVALSLAFLILSIYTEALIRWRPRGPQPAAFGNLEVLVSLIDEWDHPRLCWGDKGEQTSGIRLAGTGGVRLHEVYFDAWYLNLDGTEKRLQRKVIS